MDHDEELIDIDIFHRGDRMAHITVLEAEKLLDQEIPVLDKGFVRLVDYMGGDSRIVQTARVSYGEGTKTVRQDAGLIDYLLRHEHTSPFEHVIFELHCKMPIFVARQWVRHRTARLNEISGRYSVMKDEFYLPPREQISLQSIDNKQGRNKESVPVELQDKVLELLKKDQSASYANYTEILNDGIARELARINLPLSMYTEWYWQMDLKNMLHFLKLRMDSHAQWEIQEYARAIAKIVKTVCPMAYESFERHILHGAKLSSDEIAAVQCLIAGKPNPLEGRRLAEFNDKLNRVSALQKPAE
jgi:thymidylate synthase (FAD)